MKRLILGLGENDGKYLSARGGKPTNEYDAWHSMLLRCTEKFWIKNPAYVGTTCSESFKSYTFFYEWCNKQTHFLKRDSKGNKYQLDKDILIKGNKVYSEDTCVFVPKRVNTILNKSKTIRGDCPIGVFKNKLGGRFIALCSDGNGGQTYLGTYATMKEAFQTYKTFKEALIKQVANEYKEQLDSRVYAVLMCYQVNIED
jgi:hypothetical protein